MRDDELESVFFSKDAAGNAEAEILRSLLGSAGIDSIVRWVPPTFQSSGGVRLLVLSSHKQDAEEIIREAQESA